MDITSIIDTIVDAIIHFKKKYKTQPNNITMNHNTRDYIFRKIDYFGLIDAKITSIMGIDIKTNENWDDGEITIRSKSYNIPILQREDIYGTYETRYTFNIDIE